MAAPKWEGERTGTVWPNALREPLGKSGGNLPAGRCKVKKAGGFLPLDRAIRPGSASLTLDPEFG